MLTISYDYTANGPASIRGLSTDTKPMNVPNGSDFFEIDTSKVYMFDAENAQWREV